MKLTFPALPVLAFQLAAADPTNFIGSLITARGVLGVFSVLKYLKRAGVEET